MTDLLYLHFQRFLSMFSLMYPVVNSSDPSGPRPAKKTLFESYKTQFFFGNHLFSSINEILSRAPHNKWHTTQNLTHQSLCHIWLNDWFVRKSFTFQIICFATRENFFRPNSFFLLVNLCDQLVTSQFPIFVFRFSRKLSDWFEKGSFWVINQLFWLVMGNKQYDWSI